MTHPEDAQNPLEVEVANRLVALDGPVDAGTLDELEKWGARSPQHRREFVTQLARQEVLRLVVAAGERKEPGAAVRPLETPQHQHRRFLSLETSLSFAATVLLVIGLVALAFWYPTRPITYEAGAYARSVTLNDGSTVTLYAHSRITARMYRDHRVIWLEQRGAALDIHRNEKRPMTILADAARIEVLGTKLNILKRPDRVAIFLTEGHIAVSGSAGAVRMSAGQFTSVGSGGRIAKVQATPAAGGAERAEIPLELKGTTLAAVADRFNEVNVEVQFEVSAPVARDPFGGSVDLADPESWIAVLRRDPNLRVERGQGLVRIMPANGE